MELTPELRFRMRLAEGYLGEAVQDIETARWRSCVDNSQLAVENAAKAALARIGPVGKTHAPAVHLRVAIKDGRVPEGKKAALTRLAELSERLGASVHVTSDYGDENSWLTPWEIFGEADARAALGSAQEAVEVARSALDIEEPDVTVNP